ncbi:ribosome biogenesis GTPase YlqF [Sporomusa acidovorans]|uniref:Ribosome biogenesis GTPase A n=1 Tax=Sporomusa acidovorans (strain ATCC 49682 / DSM 3132 / Mol) TaxID=1123286 RepID=A0ABZ3J2E7_SPOA4|nr:ribosome biogenesis GTPase YlqF [Sporomusa acidovorans]OZC20024.1 ribosome biogenesis GTPase A [Sporomusa acidovorans DSM 3132]SDD47322.1 ribosome biogenesis GTPase A [Sporomusa acidovorans]
MHIHWFPGHMAKAQRMIREQLTLIDVVIELLDARIPQSSANPIIAELVGSKSKVVALNKADLAEPVHTTEWVNYFRDMGFATVTLDAASGKGTKELVIKVEQEAREKIAKLTAKGIKGRAVRAMILGIPNVGKSSLINRLLGTATAKTGDKPGVTRGQQWLKVGKNLELLDTPGVLWPRMDDQEVAFKLAVTGAIKDDIYDMEKVILHLLEILNHYYSDRLCERYKLTQKQLPADTNELLSLIGSKRGCLRSGGVVDFEKVRRIILTDFRSGKLGPITLDRLKN